METTPIKMTEHEPGMMLPREERARNCRRCDRCKGPLSGELRDVWIDSVDGWARYHFQICVECVSATLAGLTASPPASSPAATTSKPAI